MNLSDYKPKADEEARAQRVLLLLTQDDRDDVARWHHWEMARQRRRDGALQRVAYIVCAALIIGAASAAFVHLVSYGRAEADFHRDCREWAGARLGAP